MRLRRGVREVHATTTSCTIEPPFARPRLEPRQGVLPEHAEAVARSSLLTRGHVDDAEPSSRRSTSRPPPDLQGWTIWETIANTIDDDDLTLYLILDEAHRGFNTRTSVATSRRSCGGWSTGHAG